MDFQEVSVTRFSIWLVAITASLGLAAGQAAKENPKLGYSPCEIQIGASFVGYDSQRARGLDGYADVAPKGAGLAPSLKFSVDMLPFNLAGLDMSLLFSGSWRFTNDVPLEAGSLDVPADLRHKSQMSLGALLKVNLGKSLDLGVGIDERQDWMYAKALSADMTDSEDNVWRPWLRAQARYLFDRGTNLTPFIGVEAAFALAAVETDSANYYLDYFNNTGQEIRGMGRPLTEGRSPESFTRGHAPLWEVAIVGGVRFGRHCK